MTLQQIQELLQLISTIVSILGVPTGIYLYYRAKRKEQIDRELGTYNALDQNFTDYLKLCLENPDLDVFDVPLEPSKKPTPDQIRREQIIFCVLVSILERAFLMYQDQSSQVRKDQWSGWERYMHLWAARTSFRRAWSKIDPDTYDQKFFTKMDSILKATTPLEPSKKSKA